MSFHEFDKPTHGTANSPSSPVQADYAQTGIFDHPAFLEHSLGDGYEAWDGFYEYHLIGYEECENFDYEAYRANGFQVPNPRDVELGPEPRGLAY